jgi:hypothetical protein
MPSDTGAMQMFVRVSDQMIGWAATPEQAAQYIANGFEQTPAPEPRDPNTIILIRADGAIAVCHDDAEELRLRSLGFCMPFELPEPKRARDFTDDHGDSNA